jgi:hypothetical protein
MKALLASLAVMAAAPGIAHAQSAGGADEELSSHFRTTQEQVEHDQPTKAPASRKTLAEFARCVAEHDGLKARVLLLQDFHQKTYHDALDKMLRANRDCVSKADHRSIGSGELAFAAALAEELLKRDAAPLNMRLAKAAAGKPAATFGPVDAAAMCTAKSAPDQVGGMFASEPDSRAEDAAAEGLAPVLAACAKAVGSPPISATPFGLRTALATAAFRLLAAQEA